MMLGADFAALKKGVQSYLLPGLGIGGLLLAELFIAVAYDWHIAPHAEGAAANPPGVTNTAALGHILYTDYVYYFEVAGLILLVAMIGAIVLTLRHKANVKRQDIIVQNARTPALAISLRKVATGQGLQDADAAEWVQ